MVQGWVLAGACGCLPSEYDTALDLKTTVIAGLDGGLMWLHVSTYMYMGSLLKSSRIKAVCGAFPPINIAPLPCFLNKPSYCLGPMGTGDDRNGDVHDLQLGVCGIPVPSRQRGLVCRETAEVPLP